MRTALAPWVGTRRKFRAIFDRTGTDDISRRVTMLFEVVQDVETGAVVSDHVWVKATLALGRLALCCGDRVEFSATIERYARADGEDYGLVTPIGARKVRRMMKQRTQGGGGMDVPRVDPTASVAVARASRVAPEKRREAEVAVVAPDVGWDVPGALPEDAEECQRWLAKVAEERAAIEAEYPSQEPGVRRTHILVRRVQLLNERKRALLQFLRDLGPQASIASQYNPQFTTAEALERRRADVEALLAGEADTLALLKAMHALCQRLANNLQGALGLPDKTTDPRFLTGEEMTLMKFTRRWITLQEEAGGG